MFFIFGINRREEDLGNISAGTCSVCGLSGNYDFFVTYQVLSIFFLPIIKWDRKYYLKERSCNSLFEINEELGREIEAGRKINISDSDMKLIVSSYKQTKTCPSCGYQADPSFDYCPKCGQRLWEVNFKNKFYRN